MELVKLIRKQIRHGDYTKIAKSTGVSTAAVWNTMNSGGNPNLKVIQAALSLIEERKKHEMELQERVKSLLDES